MTVAGTHNVIKESKFSTVASEVSSFSGNPVYKNISIYISYLVRVHTDSTVQSYTSSQFDH